LSKLHSLNFGHYILCISPTELVFLQLKFCYGISAVVSKVHCLLDLRV